MMYILDTKISFHSRHCLGSQLHREVYIQNHPQDLDTTLIRTGLANSIHIMQCQLKANLREINLITT